MEQALKVLETAISDVGYWRWWTSELPHSIQLEFGGTQLWFPPASPDGVASGLLAVRLRKPKVAAFLTSKSAKLPDDWPEAMQRDEFEPFRLGYDRFTFTSHDEAARYLADAASIKAVVGLTSDIPQLRASPLLAFWAGPVGFVGVADSIALFSMHGEVELASVPELQSKWWTYWKEYWARKRTPNPMPKDYACEVCIPGRGE
jgi:hypothetical protein